MGMIFPGRNHLLTVASSSGLFSVLNPPANVDLTVPVGQTYICDIDSASIGCVEVYGTLIINNAKTLTCYCIEVFNGGKLQGATLGVRQTGAIVLTGAYDGALVGGLLSEITNPGQMRGIQAMPGGTIDLWGTIPTVLWTTLNAHAAAGDTTLTLATSPGWASGDEIAIAYTDFNGEYADLYSEQRTLSGATSGTTATFVGGLTWARWGLMQYPLDTAVSGSAMSLTAGTFTKAHAQVPGSLDCRARVFNLTRGFTISCPVDTDWTQKGHGVHMMWMASLGLNPLVTFNGVTVKRGGQRGMIGRYPFHAHMNSYDEASGALTQDTPLNSVQNCVVLGSENRGFVVHGTCGMTWNDNIGFDIKGHAFFMEDGSERRNNIYRNSMMRIRPPNRGVTPIAGSFVSMSGNGTTMTVNWTGHGLYDGQRIKTQSYTGAATAAYKRRVFIRYVNANQFTYASTYSGTVTGGDLPTFGADEDRIKIHDAASSGFWITNMDNKNVDNYASDANASNAGFATFDVGMHGNGMWCSLATQCFGHSVNVPVIPTNGPLDTFSGFTGHSNHSRGLVFSGDVIDEEGNATGSTKFMANVGQFSSTDHVLWKNSQGGYLNNVGLPIYQRWTCADNWSLCFEGSTNNGGISNRHLLIAQSLNNVNPEPATNARSPFYPQAAFATYHGTVKFSDLNAINYLFVKLRASYVHLNGKAFGGGVMPGGSDFYDEPGIANSHGANTNIRMSNSHPGPMCPPLHLDGMLIDGGILNGRHYSIATVWQDLDGKYGTAGRFQLPFTHTAALNGGGSYDLTSSGVVDDYFLSGAASPVDGPTTGTVVCKTTDTRYFGMGSADTMTSVMNDMSAVRDGTSWPISARMPMTITRQNTSTGATIGTPHLIKDGILSTAFQSYRHTAMQLGGRYSWDFTDGTSTLSPPVSYFRIDITNANNTGDYVLLGFPWANASVPRVGFGNNTTGTEAGTFPSAADVTAGRAMICSTVSSGSSIAAVLADTTGNTVFRDTTNNRLWMRYTAKPYTANPAGVGLPRSLYDTQTIFVKV